MPQITSRKCRYLRGKTLFKNRNEELKIEIEQWKKNQRHLKPVPTTKSWTDLGSDRAKYHRKMKYKELIGDSLKYITECKRAKLTITLGHEDVDLNWSEEEMKKYRGTNVPTLNSLDQAPTSPDRGQSSDANDQGNEIDANAREDMNNVFDSKFKFTKRHKRKIITVLDRHRISHRAYHAIRKAANKNWPSLHNIKKEKRQMSKEIDFTTEQEVPF